MSHDKNLFLLFFGKGRSIPNGNYPGQQDGAMFQDVLIQEGNLKCTYVCFC